MKHLKTFMKNRGFTDQLYFLNLKLSWYFLLACFLLNLFSGVLNITDLSIINAGVPVVFGELGIHTGFIIWKAKNENIAKHGGNLDE